MKGFNFNSRCGESILKNGNLDYFLAENEDEYIEKAVFLAQNTEKLEQEKESLFNNILNTSLFDSKKFAENLKNELLKIYKRDI